MASVEQKIQNAATKNKELLTILAETDDASSAYEQKQRYMNDINAELEQTEARLKHLSTKITQEKANSEKYRNNFVKRFAYRAGGQFDKFEAKASKEEQDYHTAIQEEQQLKNNQTSLHAALTEAKAQQAQYSFASTRHQQAQSELDTLYDSIFGGKTPTLPDEDEKERLATQALESFRNLRLQLEAEQDALQLLKQARTKMGTALAALDQSLQYSHADIYAGGVGPDIMERNALSQAGSDATEAQKLIAQAARMSSGVNGDVGVDGIESIPYGHIMGDVMFDDPYSDRVFHEKIKKSNERMTGDAKLLDREYEGCKGRVEELKGRLRDEGMKLQSARSGLQETRERAFETVAGGGGN